ncbi:Hypp7916 [Branchiostoma lanceolatum]|uniref:Hypp7916 protein n=1 Tax=Branchiostoma lanceolatum TaxID=7740 RepID=A0A8J9Z4B0_BRALA|nr:Hypp7916 [Branchiostoma lanceolatum]
MSVSRALLLIALVVCAVDFGQAFHLSTPPPNRTGTPRDEDPTPVSGPENVTAAIPGREDPTPVSGPENVTAAIPEKENITADHGERAEEIMGKLEEKAEKIMGELEEKAAEKMDELGNMADKIVGKLEEMADKIVGKLGNMAAEKMDELEEKAEEIVGELGNMAEDIFDEGKVFAHFGSLEDENIVDEGLPAMRRKTVVRDDVRRKIGQTGVSKAVSGEADKRVSGLIQPAPWSR